MAEFRNLQDRTKRDIAAARDFAITKFAKDLIESVDNLDRALTTVSSEKLSQEDADKDLLHLHSGLRMTENILMQTLKKHGLERFDPSEAGEKFDPNLHEATFMTKMEDKEDGSVFMTQQKGFLLNGRVVRVSLCHSSWRESSPVGGMALTVTITGCQGWCCEELMAQIVKVQGNISSVGAETLCTMEGPSGAVNVGKS